MKANIQVQGFDELRVWQHARQLCLQIWDLTILPPFSKDWGLKDQINRASGSIMDNIAEGFGRGGNKEFIHFLFIANASCKEVQSQLYRALDRKHIDEQTFHQLQQQTNTIGKMLTKFIQHLKNSNLKGKKFN